MANDTIVDIYCHIMPEKFSEQMSRIAPRLGNIAARLRGVKKLFDLDERFREMDQFGDYREILYYDGQSESAEKDLWSEREYGDFTLIVDWRLTGESRKRTVPVVLPNGGRASAEPLKPRQCSTMRRVAVSASCTSDGVMSSGGNGARQDRRRSCASVRSKCRKFIPSGWAGFWRAS